MSEQNENWRAKSMGTIIRIRLLGAASDHESCLPHQDAIELRDQITAALEEAKRLEDPFEKWWAGDPPHHPHVEPDFRFIPPRFWVRKDEARMIFDAIRKAAP